MSGEKFFVTTAIPYPNAAPHVGTAFEAIGTDVVARWKRLTGCEVFFLTGTDEHAEKVSKVAASRGITPQQLVAEMADVWRDAWHMMEISEDRFIRTEDDDHKRAVAEFWRRVRDSGDIYLGSYEGPHCMPCESYWSETQAKGGVCPECGRKLEVLKEPAYFFALSRYQERLEKLFRDHPDFLLPEFRRREMEENFLRPGLQDICVSRTTIHWGIPVPDDPKHVVYVWFDALINYLTGAGFATDEKRFAKWWPADLHVVGKDIVRFHTLLWPAMLMAADLPLPRRVFAHGFVHVVSDDGTQTEGVKMSKSLGNIVAPGDICAKYGPDALRYFLLREIPYAGDGNYSERNLAGRYNNDLANDLGNLVLRTLSMIERYFDGKVPAGDTRPVVDWHEHDKVLHAVAEEVAETVPALMDTLAFAQALETLWTLVRAANRYVEENRPWTLAKDPAESTRLGVVMYNLAESCRLLAIWLTPFIPGTAAKIREQLALDDVDVSFNARVRWGLMKPGTVIRKGPALFPRLELPGDKANTE
ncbi:MAG TPA: methionine--tRNA ligase [Planctomycetota bacterium]|nr:methionine--tRNA ligase [Planctomycetota bacterium]